MHLTSVVPKVVERTIGNPPLMFLEAHGFDNDQWAFRKKCSARDLALICVTKWILAICTDNKIGVLLGDITVSSTESSRITLWPSYVLWELRMCT